MKRKDLRLNSISRYRKQSPEYVLEEHGHCEVPAGCGGVVLRWRNPHLAIPVELWSYTTGEAEFRLDGQPPTTGRPLVPYGEHVFTWTIAGFDSSAALLLFAGIYDEQEKHSDITITPRTGNRVSILSAPDGTWHYTLTPPPNPRWMTTNYDANGWATMIARTVADEHGKRHSYLLRKLERMGALPLGIEGQGATVWIRRQFTLADVDAPHAGEPPQAEEHD